MEITGFGDMYLAELQELRSAQVRLTEAHQRMAANPRLTNVFVRHRGETQLQKEQLDGLLRRHGANPQAHTDQTVEAMIKETEKMMSIVKGNDLRDAALIASAQKVAHYEIAACGTAAALAGQFGLRGDQKILHACLDEEKRDDALLTQIAKSEVNPDAVAAASHGRAAACAGVIMRPTSMPAQKMNAVHLMPAVASRLSRLTRQAWDGELPLPVVYWLWGVAGNLSFALLLWRAAIAARRGSASQGVPWLVYFCSLAWFVLIFRGIWRSAGAYMGPPIWPALARLGVLVGVSRMAAEAVVLARLR